MSYRTFKRVLGETNLERKCRWWFGISLFVMLTLSFTWYGRQTDKLVEDQHPDAEPGAVCAPAGRSCTSRSLAEIEKLRRRSRTSESDFDGFLSRPGPKQHAN